MSRLFFAAAMLERTQERVTLAHEPPFELGAACFRPSHRLVGNRKVSVVVEPRVMQLLVALARADGAILSRDDIIEQCWDGRIVGNNALHRAVRHARRVLEQVGEGTIRIETIKGVGYRLCLADAPAEPFQAASGVAEPAGRILSRRRALLLIGAGTIAASGGYALVRAPADRPSEFAVSLFSQAEAVRQSEFIGSREQAIALYREALRDSPGFAAAWAGLSLAYCQLMEGALDAELPPLANLALSAADRCLQLDPASLEGKLAKLVVPSHFRRWQERRAQLERLAGERPANWTLNAYLGRVTADVGDARSAADFFARAHQEQPAAPGVAGQLAYALWAAGMLHDVEQLLEVGSKRWQRSWFLWNARFNYLAYSGQFDAAVEQARAKDTLPFNLHPDAVAKRTRLVRALQHGDPGDGEASKAVYLAEALEHPSHVRNAALALAALGARGELIELLRGYLLGRGTYTTAINTYSRRPTFFFFLPPFAPYWSDPAFVDLVTAVGLKRPGVR